MGFHGLDFVSMYEWNEINFSVGIIGSVGDLQSGHLFVSQFTSYLYILLGD